MGLTQAYIGVLHESYMLVILPLLLLCRATSHLACGFLLLNLRAVYTRTKMSRIC